MRALAPKTIRPPFGHYSHGIEIPAGYRLIQTSGQLGAHLDDQVPESAYEQAIICFKNLRSILREGKMSPANVIHISAYVTSRDFFPDYMRARDEFIGDTVTLPSSTLLIVSGFTRPEFKVEVELMAAGP